jgi:hypothetical protein
MYTDIPTKRIVNIIQTPLKYQNTQQSIIKEIINITHYDFRFNNDYYRQGEGLAMGAPSSAVLAEIFLQFI